MEVPTKKILTKADLIKCWYRWEFQFQSAYSYERMQGPGFLNAMAPALEKLYSDDPERDHRWRRN